MAGQRRPSDRPPYHFKQIQIEDPDFWEKFLAYPAMYAGNNSRDSVVSFISGYEYGSGDNSFTRELSAYFASKAIPAGSRGWWGQVDQCVRELGRQGVEGGWVGTFQEQALKMLQESK